MRTTIGHVHAPPDRQRSVEISFLFCMKPG
jgi:hypothetical protein